MPIAYSKMETKQSFWVKIRDAVSLGDLFGLKKPTKYQMIEGSTITLMGLI